MPLDATPTDDDLFRFREPGDDDDIDEEHVELMPLGVILRSIELDERERRLLQSEGARKLERDITARMAELASKTMWAVRNKKRAPSPAWELLGKMTVEKNHGGADRVWFQISDHPQGGEWRSVFRKRCRHPACRHCGGTR